MLLVSRYHTVSSELYKFLFSVYFFYFWATVCKTVRPMLVSDRCPVCLSVLSVMLVYCGQTAGWIKMKLGTEAGLGPGDIVLDGDPAPLPKRGTTSQFSVHVYCGQTVAHLSYCWALVKCSYGICSSLGKTGGGKREFLERIVPVGELYTSEWNWCVSGGMNGHVGSNNVGYDGTHGGYGFGARNADGSRF